MMTMPLADRMGAVLEVELGSFLDASIVDGVDVEAAVPEVAEVAITRRAVRSAM